MIAHRCKQQSCFADLDGSRDCGEAQFPFSWRHQHPNNHQRHQQRSCQQLHYGSVPGDATLPRRRLPHMSAWRLDHTSPGSPCRLGAHRTRGGGGSCDLWPPQYGYKYYCQALDQVNVCCGQSESADDADDDVGPVECWLDLSWTTC